MTSHSSADFADCLDQDGTDGEGIRKAGPNADAPTLSTPHKFRKFIAASGADCEFAWQLGLRRSIPMQRESDRGLGMVDP